MAVVTYRPGHYRTTICRTLKVVFLGTREVRSTPETRTLVLQQFFLLEASANRNAETTACGTNSLVNERHLSLNSQDMIAILHELGLVTTSRQSYAVLITSLQSDI